MYRFLLTCLTIGFLFVKLDIAEAKQYKSMIEGSYQTQNESASISIWQISSNKIKISGEAFWKGSGEGQIHFGILEEKEFNFQQKTQQILYQDEAGCKLIIKFLPNQLQVTQNTNSGECGGSNVTFAGTYSKKGPPK